MNTHRRVSDRTQTIIRNILETAAILGALYLCHGFLRIMNQIINHGGY